MPLQRWLQRGDGESCRDIDECAVDNGGCDVNAMPEHAGSRECRCNGGYEGDGESCRDIDECAVDNGGCDVNAQCQNTAGSRDAADGYEGDGEAVAISRVRCRQRQLRCKCAVPEHRG